MPFAHWNSENDLFIPYSLYLFVFALSLPVSSKPHFAAISFAVLDTDLVVSCMWIDIQKSTEINGAQKSHPVSHFRALVCVFFPVKY